MVKTRQILLITVAVAVMGNFYPLAAEVIDRIVAIVNNDIITLSDLNKSTQGYKNNILSSQNSDARKKELITQLESDMLGQLVENVLTLQEAQKYNIKVLDQDIDNAVENFKKTNNLDDERLKKGLAAEGLTLEDYRNKMKDQIRQSMLVNRAVRSKIIITDEEISAYYNDHKDQFTGIKKFRLQNILIQNEQDIQTVVTQLKDKASFSQLAREYSIGSNASEGGELGLFDISSFSDDIRNAIQDLKKGQFTQVLKTGNAYQIIYVDDIIMEGSQTVEQAKEKIQNILFRAQGEKQFKEWMEALKKNAHIKLML